MRMVQEVFANTTVNSVWIEEGVSCVFGYHFLAYCLHADERDTLSPAALERSGLAVFHAFWVQLSPAHCSCSRAPRCSSECSAGAACCAVSVGQTPVWCGGRWIMSIFCNISGERRKDRGAKRRRSNRRAYKVQTGSDKDQGWGKFVRQFGKLSNLGKSSQVDVSQGATGPGQLKSSEYIQNKDKNKINTEPNKLQQEFRVDNVKY